MSFFAPQLEFARRRYRLGSGYGPMTLPQGNGAPAVPTAQRILFDWDPSFNPLVDRAGGIALTNNGVTFEVQRGQACGVFNGSSYLLSSASPFASLASLSGGASVYFVCERTDAAASSVFLGGLHVDDGATTNNCLELSWTSANALIAYKIDAGTQGDDNQTGLSRNQITIASAHYTPTSTTARVDGTGTATATASLDPGTLDAMIFGASSLNTATPPLAGTYFTGRIYRILVVEGDYEAAVLSYLQTIHGTA